MLRMASLARSALYSRTIFGVMNQHTTQPMTPKPRVKMNASPSPVLPKKKNWIGKNTAKSIIATMLQLVRLELPNCRMLCKQLARWD